MFVFYGELLKQNMWWLYFYIIKIYLYGFYLPNFCGFLRARKSLLLLQNPFFFFFFPCALPSFPFFAEEPHPSWLSTITTIISASPLPLARIDQHHHLSRLLPWSRPSASLPLFFFFFLILAKPCIISTGAGHRLHLFSFAVLADHQHSDHFLCLRCSSDRPHLHQQWRLLFSQSVPSFTSKATISLYSSTFSPLVVYHRCCCSIRPSVELQ